MTTTEEGASLSAGATAAVKRTSGGDWTETWEGEVAESKGRQQQGLLASLGAAGA